MKRIHIHVNCEAGDFEQSQRFYSTLFGEQPGKTRDNYAKWQLRQPAVNFVLEVIEIDGNSPGIHHVGVQVDDADELEAIRASLADAAQPLLEVGETTCCFAHSEKHWTRDPSGVKWEAFRSLADVEDYGAISDAERARY